MSRSLSELVEDLKDEQHKLCAYGTREGDGGRCDCKFNHFPRAVTFRGEITGCPELRSAIRILQALARVSETNTQGDLS